MNSTLKRLMTPVLPLVVALSCCCYAVTAMPVTVVSYNARHIDFDALGVPWDQRKEIAFEVLRAADPDLLVLQEASATQRADLADALDWLECTGFDADFDNLNAIFVRSQLLELLEVGTFWLSDRPDEPHSITWENEEPRFVTWARLTHRASGRDFVAYNTHLDHRNQPSRLKSIDAILSDAAERAVALPLVLTGDLNAKPHWPELDMLLHDDNDSPHLPLIDHLGEFGADDTVAGTFHSFDAEPDFARIDYILSTDHSQSAPKSVVLMERCNQENFLTRIQGYRDGCPAEVSSSVLQSAVLPEPRM